MTSTAKVRGKRCTVTKLHQNAIFLGAANTELIMEGWGVGEGWQGGLRALGMDQTVHIDSTALSGGCNIVDVPYRNVVTRAF